MRPAQLSEEICQRELRGRGRDTGGRASGPVGPVGPVKGNSPAANKKGPKKHCLFCSDQISIINIFFHAYYKYFSCVNFRKMNSIISPLGGYFQTLKV